MIDAAQYQRAYKYIAAQGWLRGEPDEPEPEEPELVSLSLEEIGKHYKTSPLEVCTRLRWRPAVFEKVVGVRLPEEPLAEKRGQVLQLELLRAEKARRS